MSHYQAAGSPSAGPSETRLTLIRNLTEATNGYNNNNNNDDDDDAKHQPPACHSDRQQVPDRHSTRSGPHVSDQMFSFVVPQDSDSIQVSEEGTLIQKRGRHHVRGENIAHLSHALAVGQQLVLRVQKVTRRAQSAPAFQLGFTMCDLTDAHKLRVHQLSCGSHSVCRQSFAQTVSQFATAGSVVTIKRTNKSIDIEIETGQEKRSYAMKFSTVPKEEAAFISPARTYYPFVVLCGNADAVQIVNPNPVSNGQSRSSACQSPTASEIGMQETAERLIQSLVETPVKKQTSPRSPVPRPAPSFSWASLLSSDTPFKQTARSASHYRFFPAPHAGNNIQVLQDGKLVKVKSQSGCRLAYISRSFTSETILAFKVEKEVPSYLMCSHSFVVGLTTCDKETVLKFPTHALGFCNSSRPCAGTCGYHSIPSNAHRGSIVYIERKSESVKITITGRQSWRIETLRIPEAFVGIDVYPLIEMSGAAEEVSIADVASVPMPDVGKVTTSNPRFATSMPRNEAHFSSSADYGDEDLNGNDAKIMFWTLPYAGNGIAISHNNMKVWRTARIGARHVFFNREIEIGMSIVLKVTPGGGKLAPFRFEFGFTSCSRKAVMQEKCHMIDICSRSSCRGMSHTVGLKYIPEVVSTITITRKSDLFVIDAGKGVHHRRFFKHLPDGSTPDDRWFPLLTLTGDVDAVEITDSWIRPVSRRQSSSSLSSELNPFLAQTSAAAAVPDHTTSESDSSDSSDSPSPVPVLRNPKQQVDQTSAKFEESFERMPASLSTPFRVISRNLAAKSFASEVPEQQETIAEVRTTNSSGDVVWDSEFVHKLPQSPVIRLTSPAISARTRSSVSRKWFSNSVVLCNDPLISRIDESAGAKSYIFSSKMQLKERIGFRAVPRGAMKLVFGVTTAPLLKVDVNHLPLDASQLRNHSDWFVYSQLATCVGVTEGLLVTRTHSGISLRLFDDPESEHQIISGIDASVTVYPFFQFSGGAIQLLYETE